MTTYPAPGNTPPIYPIEVFRTTGSDFGRVDVWADIGGPVLLATEYLAADGTLMVEVRG